MFRLSAQRVRLIHQKTWPRLEIVLVPRGKGKIHAVGLGEMEMGMGMVKLFHISSTKSSGFPLRFAGLSSLID